MPAKRAAAMSIAILGFGLGAESVRAVNIETLLMPGKVIAGHAKYEAECTNCHDRTGGDARQPALCRDCHEAIDADIAQRKGFHGRLRNAERMQCRACHSEHQGRDADIIKLAAEQFDHDLADFQLRGAHVGLPCASCHKAGKLHREAPGTCASCHRDDDAHGGKLGRDCGSCHRAESWRATRFDHSKTKFALTGEHAALSCEACHFGERYKGTPVRCVSCHAADDVHAGERGTDCAECHTTSGWATQRFDHAKETGFALLGEHARLVCADCHRSSRLEDPLPRDCQGCHRSDDAHHGRFDAKCEQCHGVTAWKPASFDHAKETKFALLGAHAKADCHVCHTAKVAEQKLGTDCLACHRSQDVHTGKLGRDCEQCHGVERWTADVRFDHDLSDFPLVGLHVAVPCAECHHSLEFKLPNTSCVGCHEPEDIHKGGLGRDCETCHSPNGWNIWEFDHDKETGFALTGAHARTACATCHKQPAHEVKLSADCGACHAQDDKHLGQFGRQCQRCHTTTSFAGARLQ
jgi:hypothetical protein